MIKWLPVCLATLAVGGTTAMPVGEAISIHANIEIPAPPPPAVSSIPVTVTVYWAVAAQTDDAPHIAACGPNLKPWKQFAVSRDLFYRDGKRRCGEAIRVRLSDGRIVSGVINDTMAARWTKRVDILVEPGYHNKWEGQLEWTEPN